MALLSCFATLAEGGGGTSDLLAGSCLLDFLRDFRSRSLSLLLESESEEDDEEDDEDEDDESRLSLEDEDDERERFCNDRNNGKRRGFKVQLLIFVLSICFND